MSTNANAALEDANRKINDSATPHHCLVFMRHSFGSTPTEQADNAQSYIVGKLGAEFVVSTRIYFHGHFGNGDKLKQSLKQSQQFASQQIPYHPAGNLCLQKNCGQQKHSTEARIKRAGLDYSSVRRWILANKRIILTDEVFRDSNRKDDESSEKGKNLSIDDVKQSIEKTQEKLGYEAPKPNEQQEAVQPIDNNTTAPSANNNNNVAQQAQPALPNTPATANTAPATAATPAQQAPVKKPSSGLKVYVKSRQGQSWDPSKVNQDRPLACVPLRGKYHYTNHIQADLIPHCIAMHMESY